MSSYSSNVAMGRANISRTKYHTLQGRYSHYYDGDRFPQLAVNSAPSIEHLYKPQAAFLCADFFPKWLTMPFIIR